MVHRVDGPLMGYRGYDDGSDKKIERYNLDLSDCTIFQSRFSQKAQCDLGLKFKDPEIIYNAVDSTIFNRKDRIGSPVGRKIRIVAASWSTNENKGFDVYKWLAENLDKERFDFTFVGRTPYELKVTEFVEACSSEKVAAIFKQSDIYITASLHDPCSNSLIEALSCGLPVLYRDSGGHSELVGKAGRAFSEKEALPLLLDEMVELYSYYVENITVKSMDEIGLAYLNALNLPVKN
jgi:glycosyltransferase involved in cell wall biosynthesis